MLNEWAYRLLSLDWPWRLAVDASIILSGGALAAVFHRGRAVIGGEGLFALSAIVALVLRCSDGLEILTVQAIRGDWLWAVFLAEASILLASGYALVTFGHARSRDVFGHGKAGILAVLPLANLWLMGARRRAPGLTGAVDPGRPGGAILRGPAGAVIGFVMLVVFLPVATESISRSIAERFAAAGGDAEFQAKVLNLRVRAQGVSGVLTNFAGQFVSRQELGDGWYLNSVTAEGDVLRYSYEVAGLVPGQIDGDALKADICAAPNLAGLLAFGATIVFNYTSDGVTVGEFRVQAIDCRV
ncbi:MAG: hypothetical protein WBP18_05765 [Paracoccaceae bacterium]|jgi:hypothetical protein